MGVDALTILLSLGAILVLTIFVGRIIGFLLKLALVVAAAWFLYVKVYPLVKDKLILDPSEAVKRGPAATRVMMHQPE